MYECLIQICLKALSNMLAMTYEFFTSGGVSGNNQADSPIFWGIFLLCGMCSFAVVRQHSVQQAYHTRQTPTTTNAADSGCV